MKIFLLTLFAAMSVSAQTFINGSIVCNTSSNAFSGDGSGLTNLQVGNVVGNAITNSLIWTNFGLNTLYTNVWGVPIQVSAVTANLVAAGVAGNSTLDVVLTNGMISSNNLVTAVAAVTGTMAQPVAAFVVPINGWWWFTNTSSGAGDSSTITGGQILVPSRGLATAPTSQIIMFTNTFTSAGETKSNAIPFIPFSHEDFLLCVAHDNATSYSTGDMIEIAEMDANVAAQSGAGVIILSSYGANGYVYTSAYVGNGTTWFLNPKGSSSAGTTVSVMSNFKVVTRWASP